MVASLNLQESELGVCELVRCLLGEGRVLCPVAQPLLLLRLVVGGSAAPGPCGRAGWALGLQPTLGFVCGHRWELWWFSVCLPAPSTRLSSGLQSGV